MSSNDPYVAAWMDLDTTLGTIIDEFLGEGLDDAQWKRELEARGCTWNANLRNTIIHREFVYFIPEIEQLLTEPKIAHGKSSNKSNSRVTILKRLRGEQWAEGVPDEKEERRRTRRLYGKLAQTRCFQDKVKKYLSETASVSQMSSPSVEKFANIGILHSQSIIEDVSVEQMNSLAPVGISAAVSSPRSASLAASNNRLGYGVLVPSGCPPSATFPHCPIHDFVYSNDNDGITSGLDYRWSASVDSSMDIGNLHSPHLQTVSDSPSFSFTQQGTQLSVKSTYLHSESLARHEPPYSSTQQNESGTDIDIDHLVDYNAYFQTVEAEDDTIGDGLHDKEMRTEPQKTAFDFPYRTAANSESAMSFDSETPMAAVGKISFNELREGSNLYNTISGSFQSISHSTVKKSSTLPSADSASRITHMKTDESFLRPSNQRNSCPRNDTEKGSTSLQFQRTRRALRMGRKEREKRVMLRRVILKQREQLKARNAENIEFRGIMKAVQLLQISNKRASEEIVQRNNLTDLLLQRADEYKEAHNASETSVPSPRKRVLPPRATPAADTAAGTLHSREKSTVSSSAETTTTSSSVSVNPKELRKRIGNLEGKMKTLLKMIKENEDFTHVLKQAMKHDVKHNARHDSGYESLKLGESPRTSTFF